MRQVVWCRDPDQGDIEAPLAQAVVELVVGELGDARLHLRVVAAERGQDVHEQQRGAAGPDPDGQAPGAPVRRPAGRADDLVGCGEGLPGGGHHRLGGRGDPQAPTGTFEQAQAESPLQQPQLPAQRRLGDP